MGDSENNPTANDVPRNPTNGHRGGSTDSMPASNNRHTQVEGLAPQDGINRTREWLDQAFLAKGIFQSLKRLILRIMWDILELLRQKRQRSNL